MQCKRTHLFVYRQTSKIDTMNVNKLNTNECSDKCPISIFVYIFFLFGARSIQPDEQQWFKSHSNWWILQLISLYLIVWSGSYLTQFDMVGNFLNFKYFVHSENARLKWVTWFFNNFLVCKLIRNSINCYRKTN